jgi:hypothetical protein
MHGNNWKWIMKVIIRDMETGRYVKGPATWVDTQNAAMGFKNSIAALEFCVAQRIYEVEILLLDPQIGLPLRLFPRETLGLGIPPRERVTEFAS